MDMAIVRAHITGEIIGWFSISVWSAGPFGAMRFENVAASCVMKGANASPIGSTDILVGDKILT